MCGICGELHFKGTRPDLASIRRMLDRLERRGPDHEGSYSDGPLAFGHRRLSILDLSERSNQPMVDPELGLAVVFNGTLYNFRELRAELAGRYRFFSTGDTEVILKAYHAWGEDCVKRFHGMFAFAVWDLREQRLFLGRDRMGIKPLYYSLTDQRLRFASNIQALLAAGDVDTGFDPVALHHHFTLHAVVPAPRTLFKGVRKLRPGHTLTLEHDGRVREQRYWTLEAVRPDTPLSPEDWTQAIHDSLRQAVKKTAGGGGCAGRRAALRWAGFQPAGGPAGRVRRAQPADLYRGF